jgi:hypothetical protein
MKISCCDEMDTQKRHSATVSSQRPSEYGRSEDRQKAEGIFLSAFLFSCEQENCISRPYPAFNLGAVLGGLCNLRVLGMRASLETLFKILLHLPVTKQWGVWGVFGTF